MKSASSPWPRLIVGGSLKIIKLLRRVVMAVRAERLWGRIDLKRSLVLSEVSDRHILDSVFALRVTAWRAKVEVPPEIIQWSDDFDATARHWAVLLEGKVVAAARLSVHAEITDVPDAEGYHGVVDLLPPLIGSLNRCVVHPDFRGLGLSEVLDQARINAARKSVCRSLVVCADDDLRAAKLAAEGFEFRGEGPATLSGFLSGTRSLVFVLRL